MSREANTGLNVDNIYGPRNVPDMARGNMKTEGSYNEMTLEISGENINDSLTSVLNTLPAGIRFVDFYVEVQEAFVVSGTTPALEVGTNGTEVTNGFTISESILETVGISAISTTFAGTWASTLTGETDLGLALSGSGAAVTGVGHARIVARYIKV